MASGFKDGAVDLDNLFMLYQSGTKVAATGFKNGATDIADRYQPYTTGTKRGNTGFLDGATDIAQLFQASNVPLTTVTISNDSLTATNIPSSPATCGLRFNSDGTLDENRNGAYIQLSASTDWIIPNGSADSTYDVRVSSHTGDAWTVSPIADGSWINLGTSRQWYIQVSAGGGTKTATVTFEIRKDGGSVLDSGTFSLSASSTP